MFRFAAQRLVQAIPVLVGVSIAVFGVLYLLPGDPVSAMLAGSGASAETIAGLRRQLGLDEPVPVQYLRFLAHALQGDLGRSFTQNRPVTALIWEQFPHTLALAAAALLIGVTLGFGLGIVAAVRHKTWIDTVSMAVTLLGISMPQFFLGLVLIFIFSYRLGWFPVTGQGGLARLVLPATVLGLGSATLIARLVRASMLDVLRQDYLVTARSKGLPEKVVILRHALRNALIPVVTVLGLQIGWLLGGAVVTEVVFARPGIGRLLVDAILAQDFPLVQGTVLFVVFIYVVVNLFVDVSYAIIDPRIRYDG
ncbi:MAG: ABC transporter permease [Anaerolineae bacterium]|nr:ABC transporter permease [Anaerolineae bacterium]